mmetsp:Transcript_13635/g.20760  ORF Transcript_13635/g.20760 Transcript_13635/m.20760 type:complete len:299 (-) Transcript_13635:212-1108(-)
MQSSANLTNRMRWTVLSALTLLASVTHAFVSPHHIHYPTTFTGTSENRKQSAMFGITSKGIELSNLFYDSTSTAFDSWEWTANLGAPAALVAGAVLATMAETREEYAPQKSDTKWVRFFKKLCRFMLFSSFALEVVSIFVSTVTGSVLLGHGECAVKNAVGYASPLGLLHHHHELEYLTIQITFLQGLYNWLAAVAMEMLIPKKNETKSARRMNQALASGVMSLVFWITAFYNHHLNFYSDYAAMIRRCVVLFFKTYFPPLRSFRPMSLLYGPSFVFSGALLWRAFNTSSTEEDRNDT